MNFPHCKTFFYLACLMFLLLAPSIATARYIYLEEELVQANNADLQVPGYSVPQFADWNDDQLPDLIVGQGGGGVTPAKVEVFLNSGTLSEPVFTTGFFAQSNGVDLSLPASGCLGLFPRLVCWNNDSRPDLLVGCALGEILIFLNVGSEGNPVFDAGTNLVTDAFPPAVIDVGARATPEFHDWDEDGRRDLVCGAYDGMIHVYLNVGTDTEPLFAAETLVQGSSGNLIVPGTRSSPVICDFNLDGIKDLISGNTNGQLVYYLNEGTNSDPIFTFPNFVMCDRFPIDLPDSPRSRPSVCDWTGDGLLDILIGCADGMIHLFQAEGISPAEEMPPVSARLGSPWPNPFNPQVNIDLDLPRASFIELGVYDVAGRRIKTLADGHYPSGPSRLMWNGTDDAGLAMPSGVYFVRFENGPVQSRRKVVLVR